MPYKNNFENFMYSRLIGLNFTSTQEANYRNFWGIET